MLGGLEVLAAKARQSAMADMPRGKVFTKSRRFTTAIILASLAGPLAAQSVALYSEFQRVDPFGRVVPVDRSDYPREILSPELARNAHASFHIAVQAPANLSYFLYAGSNPPNIIETRLYKEEFTEVGNQWYPDTLTPVRHPAFGVIPDAAAGIAGQTTRCYLLDIWVPPNAPVQRVRVEVLLKIGVWYIAPMEVRIVEARVPPHQESFAMKEALPRIDERSDLAAMQCVASYVMGGPQTWTGGTASIREVIRRDAEQDMAIAREHSPLPLPLFLLAEEGILQWWMQTPAMHWSGPEWYLRVRDWIYRNP
jgi:hypothetical protein